VKENTKEYYQTCITKAIAYIESNLEKNLALNTLASISHISPYHFHRLFKAFTYSTLHNYITRIRLEKAAFLLKNTNQLIITIAIECGYANAENFTRAFQNYFSSSPSTFRNKQKEINLKKEYNQSSISNLSIASPTIKEIDDIPIAYIRHQGAYDKVGETWKKLIKWGYKNWKLGWKINMYGISHDDPEITDEQHIRYDACIGIKKSFTPKGEIGYKVISKGTYAIFTHQGPYDQLSEIYDYIYSVWIFKENKKLANTPCFENYLNSPQRTNPEHLKTKIFIPLT